MKKFKLTLTERQDFILRDALDIYSRIGIGQFERVVDLYDLNGMMSEKRREDVENIFTSAKVVCGHNRAGSFGIHNPEVNDNFRKAFDVNQVLRNKIAWSRAPQGGNGVDFYTPTQTSHEDPLPSCEVEEEGEEV